MNHSAINVEERDCDIMETAEVQIGQHRYKSKFLVSSTRYDVILDTPWSANAKASKNYLVPQVTVGRKTIRVVDHFSKRPHSILCNSSCNAPHAARLFRDRVFTLQDIPESVVSDRDLKFTSHIRTHLMKLLETQIKISTSNHPKTDLQSKVKI
eukprot:IDg6569t1